jgi:hypothetical protein
MPDIPGSTNKVVPPLSPLKIQIEPPERKKKRGGVPQKSPKEDQAKKEGDSDRGKAVDVLI